MEAGEVRAQTIPRPSHAPIDPDWDDEALFADPAPQASLIPAPIRAASHRELPSAADPAVVSSTMSGSMAFGRLEVPPSDRVRVKPAATRRKGAPAWIWALSGFVVGIVFWHMIGFWHFLGQVLLPTPRIAAVDTRGPATATAAQPHVLLPSRLTRSKPDGEK